MTMPSPRVLALCTTLATFAATFACKGDSSGDDELGETSNTSSESDASESGTSESGTSETQGTSDDSTGVDSETGDSTGSDSTGVDSETGDSTGSDSTGVDSETGGDPSCEDDSYTGLALAEDGWGVGDLCDEIWVCADQDQVALVLAAVPGAECGPGDMCPIAHCTLSYGAIVDEALFAEVCDALLVPGIDEAFCVVYGP
ncbi:hypothetical protein ACNOYE_00450 [Nannocystaceae bacterium ST9]